MYIIVLFSSVYDHISSYACRLREILRYLQGKPSGHDRRGLGSIRSVCRAWRALDIFFSLGVDKTISRVLFLSRCLVILHQVSPPFFDMLVFFARRAYLFENCTACHNSGFPVQRQVYIIIHVWARCVPCCVTRACAVRTAIRTCFSKKKKKETGGQNNTGGT